MPDRDALSEGNWQVLETIRQMELQAQQVQNVLRRYLLEQYRVAVVCYIARLSSLARIADGLKRELLNTKAAEVARDERCRRKRRKLDIGGGPIYAGDCRRMVQKHVEDEITAVERQLQEKKRKEVTSRVRKLQKLYPTIRAASKRVTKRYRDGVQVMPSFSLHRAGANTTSLTITTSKQRVDETLKTLYDHRKHDSIRSYHDDDDDAASRKCYKLTSPTSACRDQEHDHQVRIYEEERLDRALPSQPELRTRGQERPAVFLRQPATHMSSDVRRNRDLGLQRELPRISDLLFYEKMALTADSCAAGGHLPGDVTQI